MSWIGLEWYPTEVKPAEDVKEELMPDPDTPDDLNPDAAELAPRDWPDKLRP